MDTDYTGFSVLITIRVSSTAMPGVPYGVGENPVSAECTWGSLTEREARGVLTRLSRKVEHVRDDNYTRERFCLPAGRLQGTRARMHPLTPGGRS